MEFGIIFTAPESTVCARDQSQTFITRRIGAGARHRIYVKACDVVDGASATDFWVDQGISLRTFRNISIQNLVAGFPGFISFESDAVVVF